MENDCNIQLYTKISYFRLNQYKKHRDVSIRHQCIEASALNMFSSIHVCYIEYAWYSIFCLGYRILRSWDIMTIFHRRKRFFQNDVKTHELRCEHHIHPQMHPPLVRGLTVKWRIRWFSWECISGSKAPSHATGDRNKLPQSKSDGTTSAPDFRR